MGKWKWEAKEYRERNGEEGIVVPVDQGSVKCDEEVCMR